MIPYSLALSTLWCIITLHVYIHCWSPFDVFYTCLCCSTLSLKIFLCHRRTSNLILYNSSICINTCLINNLSFSVLSLLCLSSLLLIYTLKVKWNIIPVRPVTHVEPDDCPFFLCFDSIVTIWSSIIFFYSVKNLPTSIWSQPMDVWCCIRIFYFDSYGGTTTSLDGNRFLNTLLTNILRYGAIGKWSKYLLMLIIN